MQMRKIWGIMLDADFNPRAIADARGMPFKKSMEGAGLEAPPARTALPSAPRPAARKTSKKS
jgi:hypothetical protein